MYYIYDDIILFNLDMNESGGHYVNWNKLNREKQILYGITDMWNLKKKKSQTHSHRNRVEK